MQEQIIPQQKSFLNRGDLKKYFIIATIVLICSCAFLAILMIFFGTNLTLLKVISTLSIMYLVLVYSTNNLIRMESSLALVRGLSIAALIANFFWSVLWILIVWGVFGEWDSYTQEFTWKIIGTAAVISVFCTILSSRVEKINGQPAIIKFFKSLPLVCAAFLGIDLLLLIWVDDMDEEIIWKLVWSEIILVALQAIITSILRRNAWRLGINNASSQPTTNVNPNNPQNTQMAPTVPVAQDDTTAKQASQDQESINEAPIVQEKSYEDELRERIEQEVRAKIAAEQLEQQIHESKSV